MGWKFTFEAENGNRIMKRFRSVTTFRKTDDQEFLWWSYKDRVFRTWDGPVLDASSNHSEPVRSFKAFKRFLRKHPELKGYEVVLCHRYIGYNVTAEWED